MDKYRYGTGQSLLPSVPGRRGTPHMDRIYLPQLLPLEAYDKIIVLFSGGKDSLACVLDLLEYRGKELSCGTMILMGDTQCVKWTGL